MRVRIQREIDLAVPASVAWDYVTDWPRQAEWVPFTRVEGDADGQGGRLRAWTGVGPVGFWDTMTVTGWERSADGGGYCEVLHTGKVVRGEGEFVVRSTGAGSSRFVWAELAIVPFGRVGAFGWRVARPAVEAMLDRALRTLRGRVEHASY